MLANGGRGVNRPRCGIWFTNCKGVGSKGARKGFLLEGPRRLSAALHISTIDTTVVYTTVVYVTDTTVVPGNYGHDRRVYFTDPL